MFTLTLIIIGVALLFDFLNGMNDAANSIATIVSTRVLSPKAAVAWAAFWNFAAAFGFGLAVAKTIGKGIVDTAIIDQQLILCALLGAILWTHVCTRLGIPISVSHALIGGLTGTAIAKIGIEGVVLGGVSKVVVFIVLSPVIGMVLSFLLMIGVLWLFRRVPLRKTDRLFRIGQLVSSAFYSLGHGTNDAQKVMGIIAVLLFTTPSGVPEWMYDYSLGFYIPFWVVIAAHSSIGLGTLLGGWKVIRTMGVKLTHLKPVDGFCAELGGAIVLGGTAMAGIPVSTTHTIVGSIMGVGATRRISAVRWGIVRRIVFAWVLTIPVSGLLGGGLMWLLDLF